MKPRKDLWHGKPAVDEPIKVLQQCFEDLESGDPLRLARWNADPYGPEEVTPEVADQMIAWFDERLDREMNAFAGYHFNRSGATHKTEFYRLPATARLGLAQRLHSLLHSLPEA